VLITISGSGGEPTPWPFPPALLPVQQPTVDDQPPPTRRVQPSRKRKQVHIPNDENQAKLAREQLEKAYEVHCDQQYEDAAEQKVRYIMLET
jgi:hypothetical protein